MPESKHYLGSPAHTSASDTDTDHSLRFVHSIPEAGRLLPSSSRWNSIELEFKNLLPQSASELDSLPSRFSKSVEFNLTITDKKYFKRFIFTSASLLLLTTLAVLLIHFLPHKNQHHGSTMSLTFSVKRALLFFDAQKSGHLPENSLKFRGDSGLLDGNIGNLRANLQGGFYDSGNNVKFSFPTAYTITLLSWTVIEYHQKYSDIGELDHVKDIIKWGSDYLLKLFTPPNTTSGSAILYSQVGDTASGPGIDNDITCWQRPEDMDYLRPVSTCDSRASDLAGEIVAALSAASLVFKEDTIYSGKLIQAAEKLFQLASREDESHKPGMYTANDECGGQARKFYNSSGYNDELVWSGTWLFFATGNNTYLGDATQRFSKADDEELYSEKAIFYWNNKLPAIAILLARLRYFLDLGYPYEDAFKSSTNRTDLLMCSYLSDQIFNKTKGGLILLKSDSGRQLQYAATSSFLSKLYSDYLVLLQRSRLSCHSSSFSLERLRSFSTSQIDYILGGNPMKMSYVVGLGDKYPTHVHHRGASIPWDGRTYTCAEGDRWLNSEEKNPNDLLGAMVGGPDQNDIFLDERDKPQYTEPTISSNAGLVAALIALHDSPLDFSDSYGVNLGIDKMGIFSNIHQASTAP